MKERSSAAKERFKADQRRGSWWGGFWLVMVIGAWILSKFDLLDIKTHADLLMLPGIAAILYGLKAEIRKLIQEELLDETIE
jgi:hypothetical protein